jgi:signal transduction histidine kinase
VWISAVSPERNLLARWRAGPDRIEPVPESDGPPRSIAVTAIGEDARGEIWIGTNGGGIWRRRTERFERVDRDPTLARSWISSICRDRDGRLWVGTDRVGLLRFDAPDAPAPSARRLTTRDGLSSMEIGGVAEDRFSRIYVLTSSGVDRFPAHGEGVEHFSSADGLPGGRPTAIFGARDGTIWVSGEGGLAALRPAPPTPDAPVSVAFDGVEVAGERLPIPLRGRSRLASLSLPAARNSLRFEIASTAWESRRSITYRYRLDAKGPWNAVSPDRAIALPRLAAGRYRLEVEGVDSAGVVGSGASAEFSIAAPIWRQPWFLLIVAAAAAALATRIHRARIAQLMRVERIRTQIAGDLHDDIGAGLSEVAVLAEVVRQRVGSQDPRSAALVGEVAQTARDLVESMGEIVWAIDPRRDDLGGLVARLRHFGATLAETRGIRFTIDAPGDIGGVSLAPAPRRDLYLLLKEAIHNAIRHSGGGTISVTIGLSRGTLRAEVIDDGHGFDPAARSEGHGLDSMRERAKSLGAAFELASVAGAGSRATIVVPLGRPA